MFGIARLDKNRLKTIFILRQASAKQTLIMSQIVDSTDEYGVYILKTQDAYNHRHGPRAIFGEAFN